MSGCRIRSVVAGLAVAISFALFALGPRADAQGVAAGFIEVRGVAVDDASVFINDTFVGRIDGGRLLITNVYPGVHRVRVEHVAHFPQQFVVQVAPGEVVGVRVGAVAPRVAGQVEPGVVVEASLEVTNGTVLLVCFPMECGLDVIEGPDLLLRTGAVRFSKGFGDAVLRIMGLPEGEYRFRVRGGAEDKAVEFPTGVCHGEEISIFVDFAREVPNLSFSASAYPACPVLTQRTSE